MKKKKISNNGFLRFFQIAFLAVASALFIKTFVIEAFRIPTGSMEKTLLSGDFLLVNKLVYGASSPKYLPFTKVRIPYFTLPSLVEPKNSDIIVFEFQYNALYNLYNHAVPIRLVFQGIQKQLCRYFLVQLRMAA